MMCAIDESDVTVTFCNTPDSRGLRLDSTSPPQNPDELTEFRGPMIQRHCAAGAMRSIAV